MTEACAETRTRAGQARQLANAVLRAIEGAPDQAEVGARARTLRAMCDHLSALATEVGYSTRGGCMGSEIDGLRFWVTHDQFKASVARGEWLMMENSRLRAALAAIAEDLDVAEDDWVARLFTDSVERERHLRDLAATALAHSPPLPEA